MLTHMAACYSEVQRSIGEYWQLYALFPSIFETEQDNQYDYLSLHRGTSGLEVHMFELSQDGQS